ncbi:MAG: hypothetical protein VZQ98_15125 [Bacteroidales bacterium]|nr:hypothetical protein [Bacteroidales bacterium]
MEINKELNVGYVLSLQLDNGKLVVKQIPVEYPDDIVKVLNKLDEFGEHDQIYNVFDVERFVKQCNFEKDGNYGYCWPNEYNAAFISRAQLHEIDKEKYNQDLEEIKKRIIEEYDNKIRERRWVVDHYEYLSLDEKERLKRVRDEIIENEQTKYKRLRLNSYISEVKRYIYALHYDKALQNIKSNSLMYSSDTIGWYKPYFNITGNARIGLRSNFCYGRSAYFDVLLNYKGINILPYSDLVNYYWSNMMDNLRCTRSYSPYRSNWNEVLKFVEEICNWIERDSDSFEKKWIIGEVENMMEGLKTINNNIESYYKKLVDDKEEHKRIKESTNLPQIVRYRWIDDRTTNQFKTYPHETLLIIQVDKLSAALSLLEDLVSLKNIYTPVLTHIHTILQFNKEILPAIRIECENLSREIEAKQNELKQIEKDIETNEKQLLIRKNEISATLDVSNEEYRQSSASDRQTILTNVCVKDNEYKTVECRIANLRRQLFVTRQFIMDKESFKSILEVRRDFILERIRHWEKESL